MLKSYKFTISQEGEYLETRNVEEIIDTSEKGNGGSIGELKPDEVKLAKMEIERFLRTFWKGFAELWLGVEIGNENPEELKEQENTRQVSNEELRGQPMFGFTKTHATSKQAIEVFARKVRHPPLTHRNSKIRSTLKGSRRSTHSKGWGHYRNHWSNKVFPPSSMQIGEWNSKPFPPKKAFSL